MGKVIRRGETARKEAVRIVQDGGSFEEASAKTGYGVDYIRQLCTKANVHKTKQAIVQERDREIIRLAENGRTAKEIAQIFGLASVTSVYTTCRKYGVKIAAKEVRNRQLKQLYENGVSYNEMTQMTGLSKGQIKTICKDCGGQESRVCARCGKPFKCQRRSNQKFCSRDCMAADCHERNDIIRRTLFRERVVDKDITLESVFMQENGICYICGGACDYNSFVLRNGKKCVCRDYPTIEHIIPLSKGGTHSWDNVRLAHLGCNSRKGTRAYG